MTQQTICELAILFLLALSSSRIFVLKDPRSDPLAALPLIALLMALLNFFAWGTTVQEIIVASVAFFVFLWNFRALLRLNDNLIVDHYSALFILASIISLGLIILSALFILYIRPVTPNLKKYAVTKTSWQYSGNLETGYYDPEQPSDKKTAFLYKYEPKIPADKKPVILFIPNECANSFIYEPILVKLAHDGYTVFSADFFLKTNSQQRNLTSKALKRGSFLKMKMYDPESYEKWQKEEKSEYDLYLYKSLMKIVSPKENDFVILLGDCVDPEIFIKLMKHDERIDTCFDLESITDYDTKGLGPIEQTDPITAYIIGKKKDTSMYNSNHIASILEKMIEQSIQLSTSQSE